MREEKRGGGDILYKDLLRYLVYVDREIDRDR